MGIINSPFNRLLKIKLVHYHFSGEPCEACEQKGRREVVEWVETHERFTNCFFQEDWQAQLREWGLSTQVSENGKM